jgi:hypothetical protein
VSGPGHEQRDQVPEPEPGEQRSGSGTASAGLASGALTTHQASDSADRERDSAPTSTRPRPSDTVVGRTRWNRLRDPTSPARAVPRFLLVTVLGVVASGIGVYTFVEQRIAASQPPPPMSGDLNIAVAGFSRSGNTRDTLDPVVGDGLAQSVFEHLPPQFTALETAGFEIQYRAPRDIGQAKSGPTQERARQLEALARKANADVIISADLNSARGRTTVIPTLFLRQKKLQGAEELGGYHQLDPVIINGDPDSNLVMRKKLRDDLISRTGGIARLIVGLGFYDERQYSQAATEIQAAERDWADAIGRKIVHLFLGNIEGKRGNYSAAERNYRLASPYRSYLRASPAWASRPCLSESQGEMRARQRKSSRLRSHLSTLPGCATQ